MAASGADPDDYDPDAAYDAWIWARENEADRKIHAAAIAAMKANPNAHAAQFTFEGQRLWAIPTSSDQFVIRTDAEYNPFENL
ncbi:hypothetical protein CFP71_09890 [Amycolatopsis thailandensis]|uniref:Uncharacterized protein n=1 Tax=Amycolatopsis thailandensis TaxID=589330 RepID=A0A229SDP2_9PSEU|nr:hypothetical protein [Amycolatopsis thailandensis]OXM57037.1 hypothetical protein CFP71_09890 [Amycolatopsis thailandensis]